ncbi:hypothetical protein BDF21DRAFT_432467, partial [Thamnidium elegans]
TNSESESSQSSMSDLEIKRTKKIDYFSGPGEKKIGDQNIQAVEKTGNVNSMRVLSLSYIFPINMWDNNSCITSYVKQTKEVLYAFACKGISMPKISDEHMLYLKKVSDTLDHDDVDISTFTFESASEQDVNVKAACLEFVSSLAIKCSERSEDIEAVLRSCSKDFVYSCNAPNSNVPFKKRADFMSGYKDLSKYQVEDDFVKLCKHMKYSIDNQAAMAIEASVALGLLCE